MIGRHLRTDQLGALAVELAAPEFDLSLCATDGGTAGDGLQLGFLQRAVRYRAGLRQSLVA